LKPALIFDSTGGEMIERRTGGFLTACLALLVLLQWTAISGAQEHPPKAQIVISMSTTDRTGKTRAKAWTNEDLKIGEGKKEFLYISANGYSVAAQDDQPIRRFDDYRYSWEFDIRLLSTDVDSVTFDLVWQRMDLVAGNKTAAAGERQTITLAQGDRHVLDFVPCTADSSYANVVIDVQASPLENPPYAGQKLAYEMWMVQNAADGTKTTRQISITGRQGERSSFQFEPVPLPLDLRAAPGVDSPFKVYMDGTICGRLTPDGLIQIVLQSRRSYRFREQGGGSGNGMKPFTMKPGETVSIDLPSEGGYTTYETDGKTMIALPMNGVTIGDAGRIKVDLGQFLAGTKTSIILVAHPER
jgi:hypothetical protein